MLIPIAGPLTLLHHDGHHRVLNTILIGNAVMQGLGTLLALVGWTLILSRTPVETAPASEARLSFSAAPGMGGAYLAVRLRL